MIIFQDYIDAIDSIFNEAPFSEMQEALRCVCDDALKAARSRSFNVSPENTLTHISAVGAFFSRPDKLSIYDGQNFLGAFKLVLGSGFIIDPQFEVDIVNFEYGRDFLLEESQTDLAILYLVPDMDVKLISPERLPENWDEVIGRWKLDLESIKSAPIDDGSAIVSPLSKIESSWRDRIFAAKAKMVLNNFGGLHTRRFYSPDFRTVVDANSNKGDDDDWDPDKNWDVAIADRYIQRLYPFLNRESQLVQEIDRAMPDDLKSHPGIGDPGLG